MSTERIKTDVPAFPIHPGVAMDGQLARDTQGMTLRDYFAAKAMPGLLAAWIEHDVTEFSEIASAAYRLADAATGNLREDAAVAGLGSQDAADQDRSRRNEVAVALGLMNNGDFSWSFLLQKIRECAKASGHEYALPFRLQR